MATETREDIFIPKGFANEDPNLFVSINGKIWLLPRGKVSSVPTYVAAEIKKSFKAEEVQSANSEKLLEKTKQPISM